MTAPPHPLLVRAREAPADSVERHLLVVAAVESILGREVVLVGGAAINVVTGTYQPTDIDLVASVTVADRERLVDAGFERTGIGHRHLSVTMSDGEIILVEFSDSHLDAVFPPQRVRIAHDVDVAVISLDDLMMDRLTQATDGTPVTFDVAVELAVAAYAALDWAWLEEHGGSDERAAIGVPEILREVRGEARRRLRWGYRGASHGRLMTKKEALGMRGADAIEGLPPDQAPR